MTIEIRQPELEALFYERMASGRFHSIEDALKQALESAPLPPVADGLTGRTGAEIVSTMQRMPYKDIDFEPARLRMPVSESEF